MKSLSQVLKENPDKARIIQAVINNIGIESVKENDNG